MKTALHMVYTNHVTNKTDVLLDGQKWKECNDDIFNHWPTADMYSDTVALYQEIHRYVLEHRQGGVDHRYSDGADTGGVTGGFRMLVYSGDADGVCPTMGTQHWIFNVTQQEITKAYNGTSYDGFDDPKQQRSSRGSSTQDPVTKWFCNLFPGTCTSKAPFSQFWQPWQAYGRTAGFVTTLSPVLAFATVHDAGHEVPAYQPAAGLVLLQKFLEEDGISTSTDSSFFPFNDQQRRSRKLLSSVDTSSIGMTISNFGRMTLGDQMMDQLYSHHSQQIDSPLGIGMSVLDSTLTIDANAMTSMVLITTAIWLCVTLFLLIRRK